ncbi:hypothetical protein Tco_0135067 [Tanacetum coccineum]
MYEFKECSSCGALYNREQCCSNVSSIDNFIRDPNPISYDETPDSSQQPSRNCSKCGGPFGGLYCQQCTCERCRRIYTDEVCTLCCYEVEKSFVIDSNPNSFIDSPDISNPPSQPQTSSLDQWHCFHCKDPLERENSSNAITPDLLTEEPDNSLSMGEEHLSTIPKMESNELIKSSVEDLVPIPSESEGISDDTCDVPFCDNSPPLDVLNDHFEIFSDFNNDCTSSDDDYFEDIDYVEASPPDSELVSLEEVKDDILHEKLLNINLLIAKIESLNDNTTPDYVLKSPSPFSIPVKDIDSFFENSDTSLSYSDNSLPEFRTF